MKTRDEDIRDLASNAKDQCEALLDKMEAVIDGLDNEGEPEDERLCDIGKNRNGHSQMVFAAPGTTDQRTVVYVDGILALAKLLNGELQVQND